MVALQTMTSVLADLKLVESRVFLEFQLTNAKVRAAPRASRWDVLLVM